MTKWTLPQGRKPLTEADMAALTRRLAGTAVDYKELYEAALHDAKEAEAYAAELEAKLAKAISTLQYIADTLALHSAKETLAELKGEKDE